QLRREYVGTFTPSILPKFDPYFNRYVFRWRDFVDALQAQFPNIHFIATTNTFNPILSPNPTEYDIHVYQTPCTPTFIYTG
ncbi:hypothetical protein C0992_010552, partial [Termitomyces sp. T32_za158]